MWRQQKFREIYREHNVMVYNLCLNYLHNTEDAEEVTQDVFVKVHHKLHRFREDAALKTWIYRITINACLDRIRKSKSRFSLSFHTKDQIEIQINFNHPGIIIEQKEATARIFAALNRLPDKQKTALLLKTTEDLSQKEIAEIMKISEKAVESLLSRGRAGLKKILYPPKDEGNKNV